MWWQLRPVSYHSVSDRTIILRLALYTYCSKRCPISSFHNGFCLCRLCTVVWHMLATWGSSQEWSPRASLWLWMREVGIACCYSDLSMSQNGQTSIFETTAVQIISVGKGTILIEGFWNMVIGQIQWNTMKWIMFNVSQYNIHDFIVMINCLFLFICVSDQGAWWENFIIGLLDRRAMPISFLMRDVSIKGYTLL